MTRYFILANALFIAALILFLGIGKYPNDNFSVTIFGYGRFGEIPTYLAIGALALVAGWNFVHWRRTRTGLATTSIHFVLANAWFIAGLLLLVGTWSHPASATRASIFGLSRFETPPLYLTNFALFVVALFSLRRWRKSGSPGVSEGNFFALANFWFILGIALFLGIAEHPHGPRYTAIYGYGKLEVLPPYLAVGFCFTAAFWNFRRWRRAKDDVPVLVPAPVPAPQLLPTVRPNFPWQYAAFGGLSLLLILAMVVTETGSKFQSPVKQEIVNLEDEGEIYFGNRPPQVVSTAPKPTFVALFLFFVFLLVAFVLWTRKPSAADQPPSESGPGYKIILGLWIFCGALVAIGAFLYARGEHFSYFVGMIGNTFILAGLPTVARFLWISYVAVKPAAARPVEPVSPLQSYSPPPMQPDAPRYARACPKCQSPIAADAPQGLCPRCLMAGAFGSVLHPSRTGAFGGSFEPPSPEEVQEFFPHLEILGLIGHGGMGAVYQARQPNLDRIVAIKLIRPREDNPMFAERFVREARAMAKLTHPNIATIYESGDAGGSLYLIMEFVDGVTLREAIRSKVVTAGTALQIVGQLCDALEYAHSQGVVHRDIKPENILLDRAGKVKVVDFGLAKLADDNAMSLTHTRQAMGTPHYMAPDQWEKPTEVDHRADIYALGVVIYELLTGELPLGRFDPPSVKSRLDARIDEIVLKLLAKEPDRRYQRASDVRTALFNLGNLELEGVIRRHANGASRYPFFEYKSKSELLGWPLVHVVRGVDPRTGTRRVAKGWIAIGDVMAIGLVAVSGVLALGGFSLAGAFGLGLFALVGGLAIGGVAVGGTAFGFIALGGVAIGWLAIGGAAIGKYALGGATIGQVTNRHGAISDLWERMIADIGGWF